MSDKPMTVNNQFQRGDLVIYIPLAILTQIEGYTWVARFSEEDPPALDGFKLSCGVVALPAEIRRATLAEVHRIDPALLP